MARSCRRNCRKRGLKRQEQENFETEVLTRLAVIESKLDDYKKIEDISYRAYNNTKDNKKDIENMKVDITSLQKEVEGIKEQPRQRWFNLLGTIISVVVTALITFILAKIGLN